MNGAQISRTTAIYSLALAFLLMSVLVHAYYCWVTDGYPGVFVVTLIEQGIAWTATLMFATFLFMFSPLFKEIKNGNAGWKSDVMYAVFMTVLAVIGDVIGGGAYSLYAYNVGYLATFAAGLYGGTCIGLATAAAAFVLDVLIIGNTVELTRIGIMLFVSALVGAAIRGTRRTRAVKYAVPLLFIAVSMALDVVYFYTHSGYASDDRVIFFFGSIFSMFIVYCAIVMMDLFELLISSLEIRRNRDADMRLAHDIQQSYLPSEFPEAHSFSVYGRMKPAIEVGGDFFDCFKIGECLTCFAVADVSDKGLPAALFMMKSMGSLRSVAALQNDPAIILGTVNKGLSADNPAEQFVTMWVGIYDSATGILKYSCAGHPMPFLRRADGTCEKLPKTKGMMLGVNPSARFVSSSVTIGDGDVLFAYSDGINEQCSAAGEQFGHARIAQMLSSAGTKDPKEISEGIVDSLKKFAGTEDYNDDVTFICASFRRSSYRSRTFPGKSEALDDVNGFVADVLVAAGCPEKAVLKLQIVSEEIFVNICEHAYAGRDGNVTVYCSFTDGEVKLTFSDDAAMFNPVGRGDIEIDEDVGNWPIGGFGIHMIRKLTDRMDYKYFDGKNIFTVWKKTSDAE